MFFQEKAASLYNVSENNLEYDLLKVNVFYNSLMEKTVTDKKDYDLKVCSKKILHTFLHSKFIFLKKSNIFFIEEESLHIMRYDNRFKLCLPQI